MNFKIKNIVNDTKPKPIDPTQVRIVASAHALFATWVGIITTWEERDTSSLAIINNCLDNNVVSCIKSCKTSHDAWIELIRFFES